MAEPTVEELQAQIVDLNAQIVDLNAQIAVLQSDNNYLDAQVSTLEYVDNLEDIGIQLALNYISWDASIYGSYQNEQRDILREDYAYTDAEIDTVFSVRSAVLDGSYFSKPESLRRRKYSDLEISAMSMVELNRIIKRRGYVCTGDKETEIKASFKTVQAADPLLDPR